MKPKSPGRLIMLLAALAWAGCETPRPFNPDLPVPVKPPTAAKEAPLELHPVNTPLPPRAPGTIDISQLKNAVVPVATLQTEPNYPLELRKRGIVGSAVDLFTVTDTGNVRDVIIWRATNQYFGEAAADAIRQWHFRPGELGGRPVNCRMGVPITFSLTDN